MLFNIQRFSLHDGEGVRTVLFFKGCPLRCFWCANPEGQEFEAELFYDSGKCIGCRDCLRSVRDGGLRWDGGLRIRRELLEAGRLRALCPAEALTVAGDEFGVDDILAAVERDRPFYRDGGGVTLSGGEPFAQPELAAAVAAGVKERGLTLAAETCLAVAWGGIEPCLPFLDEVLADVKQVDAGKYRAGTGGDAELALKNFRRLAAAGVRITARVPVIPGFNDEYRELAAIAEFISGTEGVGNMRLLPYHNYGERKYELLGRERRRPGAAPLAPEDLAGVAARLAAESGLTVRVGG